MSTKYEQIGINYNQTRKADPYLSQRFLFLLKPNVNGSYLDIGCGTGNYTSEFQKRGFHFTGIDPSAKMIGVAKQKNQEVNWQMGSAEETGLSSESIDGLIACLTMHHWSDLNSAFKELKRILKPRAKMVIFTSTPEQMKGYWLNHYFPKMLEDSIIQMPSLLKVEAAMKNAGLEIVETEKYFIEPDLQDQFLYCGKQDPELYFNEAVRNGISSFSSLSNRQEVINGLESLRKDIDNRVIKDVIASYENDLGDYLFLIGRRKA